MDVREKLVKILADAGMGKTERNFLADHLIMSGITVQDWIPVTERLPEDASTGLTLPTAPNEDKQ